MKPTYFIFSILITFNGLIALGQEDDPCLRPTITVINASAGCNGAPLIVEVLYPENCEWIAGTLKVELWGDGQYPLCASNLIFGRPDPVPANFECRPILEGITYTLKVGLEGYDPYLYQEFTSECNIRINASAIPFSDCSDPGAEIIVGVNGRVCDESLSDVFISKKDIDGEWVEYEWAEINSTVTFENLSAGEYKVVARAYPSCGTTQYVTIPERPINTFYLDRDGDGVGFSGDLDCSIRNDFQGGILDLNKSAVIEGCVLPTGYSLTTDDCDDCNRSISPNRNEICDGIDNNCNGKIDEGLEIFVYIDMDGDGLGDYKSNAIEFKCNEDIPKNYVFNNRDCDDSCANCELLTPPCEKGKQRTDLDIDEDFVDSYNRHDQIVLNKKRGAEPSIMVLDGNYEYSGCIENKKFETSDFLDVENLVSDKGCNENISIFSKENAFYFSDLTAQWSPEPNDKFKADLLTPIVVPVTYWMVTPKGKTIADMNFKAQNLSEYVSSIYLYSFSGIEFAIVVKHISISDFKNEFGVIDEAKSSEYKQIGVESVYTDKNRLNLYFLPYDIIDEKAKATGYSKNGFYIINSDMIFIGSNAHDATTVAHELAHAFGLEHIETYLSIQNPEDLPPYSHLFNLQEVFIMNVHPKSWINKQGLRPGQITIDCYSSQNSSWCLPEGFIR
jgi:hypothetical protein